MIDETYFESVNEIIYFRLFLKTLVNNSPCKCDTLIHIFQFEGEWQ